MVRARTDARGEEVRQAAEHTLYVEGSSPDSVDRPVLQELLQDTPVRVRSLGASYHVRGAAEALHREHPHYYFLIDRDHLDDAAVEASWNGFPDPESSNLLIWRRRQIENYFLGPDYLSKSEHLTCSKDGLMDCIAGAARKRVFLDAANLVIVTLREELKRTWIKVFDRATGFGTRESALRKLLALSEFGKMASRVGKVVARDEVEERFDRIAGDLLGGEDSLAWGSGNWLHMMSGKHLLPAVVDKCFRAKDAADRSVDGAQRILEVVKDLLRKPLSEQPDDFRELHALMKRVAR